MGMLSAEQGNNAQEFGIRTDGRRDEDEKLRVNRTLPLPLFPISNTYATGPQFSFLAAGPSKLAHSWQRRAIVVTSAQRRGRLPFVRPTHLLFEHRGHKCSPAAVSQLFPADNGFCSPTRGGVRGGKVVWSQEPRLVNSKNKNKNEGPGSDARVWSGSISPSGVPTLRKLVIHFLFSLHTFRHATGCIHNPLGPYWCPRLSILH